MSLKVYKECCQNCLLSKYRIVSPIRAKEIITGCIKDQTFFICHKATMNDDEVVCKSFYDQFGQQVNMIRIAQRLNMVELVEQPKSDKLIPFNNQ